MSNARTGLWSAFGALIGGVAGAYAGQQAAILRPRYAGGRSASGDVIEDAMVIGGATGAVVGAFVGGMAAGEETPPKLTP